MAEERPLQERPAARPSPNPSDPRPDNSSHSETYAEIAARKRGTLGASSSPPSPPKKRGLGCFGIGCLGAIGVVVVVVVISLIVGAVNSSQRTSSSESERDRSNVGRSTDPIEQARVVLSASHGESYSYADIKSITDRALSYFGLPLTDDSRSRAWSSILAVLNQPELSHVSPMDVMRCVAAEEETGGMSLPDWIALCAVMLK